MTAAVNAIFELIKQFENTSVLWQTRTRCVRKLILELPPAQRAEFDARFDGEDDLTDAQVDLFVDCCELQDQADGV